jgi:hypothetical protein
MQAAPSFETRARTRRLLRMRRERAPLEEAELTFE